MADKKISQLTGASTPLAGTEVLPIVQSGSTVKVSAADVTAGRAVSASSIAVTGSTAPANGVYLPAANSVGISTASSNAVYINSSGNVAIAQGNPPTQVFNLYRSGSTAAYMAAGNSNTGLNGTYFGVDTAGNAIINQTQAFALNLQTSGVTRVGIASAGDVTVSTGNLVVGTAAKGIDFSANTHAAGMTSELLTWYEEGTWTPSLGGNTVYAGQTGRYTRIGRCVFFAFNLNITTLGTGSATQVTGLPFTSANNSLYGGHATYYDGVDSNIAGIFGYIGTTNIVLVSTTAFANSVGPSNIFKNGANVTFQGFYFV